MIEIAHIPLTQGMSAVVDAADYEWLMRWKWYASRRPNGNFYAVRSEWIDGKDFQIRMHRQIIGAPQGVLVDHINRDGLYNRRSNLRICSAAENTRNSTSARGSTSQYLGVSWHNSTGKWVAQIMAGGRVKHLGRFADEIAAAHAYDAAARLYHSDFANPNFPLEGAQ